MADVKSIGTWAYRGIGAIYDNPVSALAAAAMSPFGLMTVVALAGMAGDSGTIFKALSGVYIASSVLSR